MSVLAESKIAMPWQPSGRFSKIIGMYQLFLRQGLEHFFPETVLERIGDRSVIRLSRGARRGEFYRIEDDADGLGMTLEWLGSPYRLQPGVPMPFSDAQRRLIDALVEVLDQRFRTIYDPDVTHREILYQYDFRDLAVARFLDTPDSDRIPPALEALRTAALSTYENRRVSSGMLLLGTPCDPAAPDRTNPPGAPHYSSQLTALKSLHRICDGLRTIFLVDRRGDLAWPVDIQRWSAQVQGHESPLVPGPRAFEAHARATLAGGHVALILTPAQSIHVVAGGTTQFVFSDGRWRLHDVPSCHASWIESLGPTRIADLGTRLFRAALNLAEQRQGALFVVLRDPDSSTPQLLAPEDRIADEQAADGEGDSDHASPRLAKRALHHLVRGQDIASLDETVVESLAGIDGAVVTDLDGRLLSFGAILRVTPETVLAPRAVQGARTTAALAASFHGPVLKVSEDGIVAMYLGGRRIWEI